MVHRPLALGSLLIFLCMLILPEVSILPTPISWRETGYATTASISLNRFSPHVPYNIDEVKFPMNRAVLDDERCDKSICWRDMKHIWWTELRNMSSLQGELPELKPLSPSPNDWIVTGEEVHEDEVIILTGNLRIQAGGNLTLINCTLLMNCAYYGEWGILVNSSGTLNVLKGSNITAYNPKYIFLFYVYGRLIMHDSFLSKCKQLFFYTTEGAELYNAAIMHDSWDGIYCYRSCGVSIVNCTINNNGLNGIYCYESCNISITDCTIINNWENGILCYRSSDIDIMDCTINNNAGDGIYCYESCNISIINCVISNNYCLWGDGIDCEGSSGINIINCTISNNCDEGVDCDYRSSDISITGCTISNNHDEGILCYRSSIIGIVNCTIINNWNGIRCYGASNISITGCTISNNHLDGTACYYGLHIDIVSCTIDNNGLNGIYYYWSSDISITGCTISNNHDEGIDCDYGASVIIVVNCTIINNWENGILCYRSSDIDIMGCVINNNTGNGIYYYYGLYISIINCTISNNWDGILCYRPSGVVIINCTISNNWDGILCYRSSIIGIVNCTIINNWNGIACCRSSDIGITGCTISNNWDGIACYWSSRIAVHYCDIYYNRYHGLYNYGECVVDATYCWWGSPDGPEYKDEGDPDDPEEVYSEYGSEYLLYRPWLEKPYRLLDVTPPAIGTPSMSPEQPVEGEDVEISVNVTDTTSGVIKVILSYSIDEGITWINTTMTNVSNNTYKAIIPAQAAGTTVLYKIYACDKAGNWAKSPEYSYTVKSIAGLPEPQPRPPSPGVVLIPYYNALIFTIACIMVIIIIIALWRRRSG